MTAGQFSQERNFHQLDLVAAATPFEIEVLGHLSSNEFCRKFLINSYSCNTVLVVFSPGSWLWPVSTIWYHFNHWILSRNKV